MNKTQEQANEQVTRICNKIVLQWQETGDFTRYMVRATMLWNAIDNLDPWETDGPEPEPCWGIMLDMLPEGFRGQDEPNSLLFTYYHTMPDGTVDVLPHVQERINDLNPYNYRNTHHPEVDKYMDKWNKVCDKPAMSPQRKRWYDGQMEQCVSNFKTADLVFAGALIVACGIAIKCGFDVVSMMLN